MKTKVILNKKFAQTSSTHSAGHIHTSEIAPTLKKLEAVLGIDLINNTLGSVGKKQFSGDIDIAVDTTKLDLDKLTSQLEHAPEVLSIAKSSVIMTLVKIANYNDRRTANNITRTGYVQVDFMPGDAKWLKTYYHAPKETESQYKGAYRNILLGSIATVYNKEDSVDTISDGRPVTSTRWKMSPSHGLLRVKRIPATNKSGTGYIKKNIDTVISSAITTDQGIVTALGLDTVADLNSYESLKAAIERNYTPQTVKLILKDFANNRELQKLGVPSDVINERLV